MRFLSVLILLLAGCSQDPVEIHYGGDECAHCKMMITDGRFASQIVTETGKAIKFDAIECMAEYAGTHKGKLGQVKLWVSDFNGEKDWIEISRATFIRSEVIRSPMGAGLLAVKSEEEAKQHLSDFPGIRVTWQDLVK